MNDYDVISALREDIFIKGVPIKESDMFKTLSDMNVSEQYVSDYSNGLHNLMKIKGKDEAERKILVIFRINPLVAVRIIESCQIVEDIEQLAYSIKLLFSVLQEDGYYVDPEANKKTMILNNRVPYVALLIEAVFQRSIGDSTYWDPDMFLRFAQSEDLKLYKKGIKTKYLNAYNIRHILGHIPENRQIEFINWFWDKHYYASQKFGKKETFASGRVRLMMHEITEGSIWQHLENEDKQELSEREQERLEKEKDGIRSFIRTVISEGRHLEFIKRILGESNFYEKLTVLMGDGITETYDSAVDNQEKLELKEKLKENRLNEKKVRSSIAEKENSIRKFGEK